MLEVREGKTDAINDVPYTNYLREINSFLLIRNLTFWIHLLVMKGYFRFAFRGSHDIWQILMLNQNKSENNPIITVSPL